MTDTPVTRPMSAAELARMYRGQPPETGPTLQAIATMELG